MAGIAWGQEWLGPYNALGDTAVKLYPVVDGDDNVHSLFYIEISQNPHAGDCFCMKQSPTGEVLEASHRLTFDSVGCSIFCQTTQNYPYIDAAMLRFEAIKLFRFDYDGVLVEAPHTIFMLENTIGWTNGLSVSVDTQNRYHIIYSTDRLEWPAVIYARVSEQGIVEVGPDTLQYGLPYYHVRFSSAVTAEGQFFACWSNVDGFDTYIQAVAIDSGGDVVVPAFNPLPNTDHVSGAGAKLKVNGNDRVVMQYSWNPPGQNAGQHELYRFDSQFNFIDSVLIYTNIVDMDNAWGHSTWDADGYNRILFAFQTGVLEAGEWHRRAYTWAYDFDLNMVARDSLPTEIIEQYRDLSVVCGSGLEAVWMLARPFTTPYDRLFSWHRIVNADCLAVSNSRDKAAIALPQFTLWPNPTNGNITIKGPWAGLKSVSIYDVLGRRVQDLNLDHAMQQAVSAEVGELPSGNYFFRFVMRDGMEMVPLKIVR